MYHRVFAVVLTEGSGGVHDVADRIDNMYPTAYRVAANVFLILSDDLAEDVAHKIGIKGDSRIEDARGAVFKLNGAYAGYAPRAMWDWLSEAVPQV